MYVIASGKMCTKNVFLYSNLSRSIGECNVSRPSFRDQATASHVEVDVGAVLCKLNFVLIVLFWFCSDYSYNVGLYGIP